MKSARHPDAGKQGQQNAHRWRCYIAHAIQYQRHGNAGHPANKGQIAGGPAQAVQPMRNIAYRYAGVKHNGCT